MFHAAGEETKDFDWRAAGKEQCASGVERRGRGRSKILSIGEDKFYSVRRRRGKCWICASQAKEDFSFRAVQARELGSF